MSDLLLEPWRHLQTAAAPKPQPETAAPLTIEQAVTSAPAIASATDKITTARVLMNMANNVKEGRMPLIEIKGLAAAVQAAKTGISSVRAETAGLSTDAAALIAAVQDVRSQIKQAQADLKFEAEQLGNGSG